MRGVVVSLFKQPVPSSQDSLLPILTPLDQPYFPETFSRDSYRSLLQSQNQQNGTHLSQRKKLPPKSTQNLSQVNINGRTFTQHIMQNINKRIYEDTRDPRESLMKFSRSKEGEISWVSDAYKKTQPREIYDNRGVLEAEVEFYERKKGRCVRCGLKFCTCKRSALSLEVEKMKKK